MKYHMWYVCVNGGTAYGIQIPELDHGALPQQTVISTGGKRQKRPVVLHRGFACVRGALLLTGKLEMTIP